MAETRSKVLNRLATDLVGPVRLSEVITDRPTDRYLTGILFPPRTPVGAEEDNDADTAEDGISEASAANDAVASANAVRPSTAGVSFALEIGTSEIPAVDFQICCGVYVGVDAQVDGEKHGKGPITWQRIDKRAHLRDYILVGGTPDPVDLSSKGIPGLFLHIRTTPWNGGLLVTAVLVNQNTLSPKPDRREIEEKSFFQVAMKIAPAADSELRPRPIRSIINDADSASAALIYRDADEYAVGHVCSAGWFEHDGSIRSVRTTWIPTAIVPATSPDGHAVFQQLRSQGDSRPLEAIWLAEQDGTVLTDGLERLAVAYARWISEKETEWSSLPDAFKDQGRFHLEQCILALERIRSGIRLLTDDADASLAFRLANRAMQLQKNWKDGGELTWRPFQLAFCLLALRSTSEADDPDRETMDLIWFPTGGGKTEAYLLLTAFAITLRRLRNEPSVSGGVTVLMRYTLRLLTVQQYERAAALICACEVIRVAAGRYCDPVVATRLTAGPQISLGLWVGEPSSPNRVDDAIEALSTGAASTPAQVRDCPCCRNQIHWGRAPHLHQIWAVCKSDSCELAGSGDHLPIWTVDEDVYREMPSLLIGTADKFAQIVRNSSTGRLFGLGTPNRRPDLIIQDELHLISGPLGTMAGIYEVAVDALCTSAGKRPKVIGSTATIRRAEDQIRALFDRDTFQFPPLGLDHRDSGFAVAADPGIMPGRLFAGVTTAGRSAKFTLQAVTASLLQSSAAQGLSDDERDQYWTLVTYFNSLRELGGALVLMQDDTAKSAADFARRRVGEITRETFAVTELTSRVESSRIPAILKQLENRAGDPEAIDIVLASNMISVGVDVSRLGVMVVNGQPKGIAEYIQATSRVGRSTVPGLVVGVYNANKARDRSHFETFRTWHQTLYREVEATSVTPFAPRARDRALHAPLVAIARHHVKNLKYEPIDASGAAEALDRIVSYIVKRAESVDGEEAVAVRTYLEQRVKEWISRGKLPYYWSDFKDGTLMVSAETAAERTASGRSKAKAWPTPNSLRSVEASVEFILRNRLGDV
jgi:hypothetical protein